ncbi:MAG TPA: type IV secretion system DNA-binding domain-containing protein [Candidatus Paceibacterota bacterium]|nr:type IV secretion system DNA-binding domain-containing protein [Candidatus Paceibacterota bacterium]
MANNNDITPIGFHNYRGNREEKFGIRLDDRRRHIYVIGKTGVGKSTLLENMAIHDIQSGKGMAFIDPHGSSAEKLLDFVPEERLDDVIYFDPSDLEHPIAFNPMEQVNTEFRHLVASGLMGVFKKIWVDAWSARMEYILNNTLLALLEFPGSTVLGVLRMFAEPEYRKKIVSTLQDPVIKAFWQNEFARYSQRLETEALAAIQNKVGQFVSNPLIRNILGQSRSTINMREIMDSGKILIVNLSKGKIGEDNSALLGAMMIARMQLAAMSRADTPEEKLRDFFLYVDEFQNFATDSFANILAEARKYRLSLVLAHQYIGQLILSDGNTKVRDAVFGNVGTLVSFRVGAPDAEFLEPEFTPEFEQQDLVNLSKANVYLKLMINGVSSRPFSATTLPPPVPPLVSHRDVIVSNSQQHYSTPRSVVEAKIASEWESQSEQVIEEKIGRRNERPLSQALRGEPRSAGPRAPRPPRPSPASSVLPPREAHPIAQPVEVKPMEANPIVAKPIEAKPIEPSRARPVPPPIRRREPSEPASETVVQKSQTDPTETPMAAAAAAKPATPKHFPRANVDIEALRRAISESLRKQNEETEAQEREAQKKQNQPDDTNGNAV